MPDTVDDAAELQRVEAATAYLETLLASWKSRLLFQPHNILGLSPRPVYRYCHVVTVHVSAPRVLKFIVTWNRHPTPQEPLPDARVETEFSLK